ncbi:hypothetical protein NC652_016213 [Populus alba x Populus x berolinensis]|nr:hypothetical protein NC652_016213 [Populus alba x Populus x berolinensis]
MDSVLSAIQAMLSSPLCKLSYGLLINYAWRALARLSEGQVDSVVVATGLFAACRGGVETQSICK